MALFEARNIHKRFGSRVVLENISLSFEAGQVSGIIGPNGAGKSTCFHVLTGQHKPDRGEVMFDGQRISGLPPQRIARMGVSRSFQLMNLFDDTVVIENVMLALPAFRARRLHAMAAVFSDRALIDQALAVLDQVGLAGRAWDAAASLSYGDRRALEIAVALAAEPRILFLDEPTSGLGVEATCRLAQLVKRLRDRYTIVMIEHDMRFLFELADRISVIHWGQVIAEGTPEHLGDNKWVRHAGSGISLIQQLRHEETRYWRYHGTKPRLDKATRLEAQTARLETGQYLLPTEAHWLSEFRRELLAFPMGKFDDQVDSLVQFLEWSASPRASGFLVERHPETGRPLRVNRPQRRY